MRWVIALLIVIALELGVIAIRMPEPQAHAAGPIPVFVVGFPNQSEAAGRCPYANCARVLMDGSLVVSNP